MTRGETQAGVPVVCGPVQQRTCAAGRELAQQCPDLVRAGLGAPGIDPPLDGVGDLQPHRHRQRPQVEPVPAEHRAIGQPCLHRRAAIAGPPGAVDLAQPRRSFRVQPAVVEPACRRPRQRRAAAPVSDPPGPVGAAGLLPSGDMGMTQAELAASAPARRDRALGRLGQPAPQRGRCCRPRRGVRTASLNPPLMMSTAHARQHRDPLADRHLARRTAHHRVGRVDHDHRSRELRPQLRPQPGDQPADRTATAAVAAAVTPPPPPGR